MVYDSYFCQEINSYDIRPWPSQRYVNETNEPNFVGALLDSSTSRANLTENSPNAELILEECPSQCRPASHQDWIYC